MKSVVISRQLEFLRKWRWINIFSVLTSFSLGYFCNNLFFVIWGLVPLLIYVLTWLIRFKIWKNGKDTYKVAKIWFAMMNNLLDAGCYKPSYRDQGVLWVDLPKIVIRFFDYELLIKIRDNPAYHNVLEKTDFSSGLFDYVFEDCFLSDDGNYWIIEFFDFNQKNNFVFKSFEKLNQEVKKVSDNQLILDRDLTIKNQHMLITGRTGSGKSYFVEFLILEWLLHGVQLFIADPKNADLSVISEKVMGKSITSFDEICSLIDEFDKAMHKRAIKVHEKLKNQANQTAFGFGMKEKVLIIDEFGAFSAQLQKLKKADRDRVIGQLQDIIFMGRQLGYYLVLVLQKTDATVIPTSVRDNMSFRICLGRNDVTTYQTVFGSGVADIPKLKFQAGDSWYIDDLTLKPRYLRTPTIDFEVIQAIEEISSKQSG